MVHLLLAIIYLAFISLGLPDSLLGSAWPSMYREFGVSVSFAGILSMIIAAGTIVSSLQSDRLTRRLGTGKVTAISVAMTAVALLGFSFSGSFWMLCLWAIPYGLGAGSVDAALNNYVALHYEKPSYELAPLYVGSGRHIGSLYHGLCPFRRPWLAWRLPVYRYHQITLTVILFFSLPLWKRRTPEQLAATGLIRETPFPEADPKNSRSKRSDGLFFLLLCSRTDRHFMGQQLSEPLQRGSG